MSKPQHPTNTTQRLIYAGHVQPDPRWAMRVHSHTFHEIIAPVRGTLHVTINGQKVVGTAGDLLIYQAGHIHEERSDSNDPVETHFVAFEHPAFSVPLPFKLRDHRNRVALMISWLSSEMNPASDLASSAVLSLMDSVVAEVLRLAHEPESSTLVTRIRAYTRTRLTQNITLDDLAEQANLSRFHFVRQFRTAAGLTPMKDLCLTRLNCARNLILTTALPLKSVAPMTGLGDEYHLSRLFRQHFGYTPGSLRKNKI